MLRFAKDNFVTAPRRKDKVKVDVSRAKVAPAGEFRAPEDVAHDPSLDRQDKKKILRQWETDAEALTRAGDEGMSGGEPARLDEVKHAQQKIGDGKEKRADKN
jgi:hypothetical protein